MNKLQPILDSLCDPETGMVMIGKHDHKMLINALIEAYEMGMESAVRGLNVKEADDGSLYIDLDGEVSEFIKNNKDLIEHYSETWTNLKDK